MSLSGLPHSEILGSKPVCGSPKLIAAYHVLHRLLAPRHSPYALSSLTILNSELTLTAVRDPLLAARETRTANRELRTTTRDSSLHTASTGAFANAGGLFLWSEKTTVCRIFSCKERNLRAALAVAATSDSTIRAHPGASGTAEHLPKPSRPPSLSRSVPLAAAGLPSRSLAHAIASARRRLVENTGLEPVTSWLQTRRSPS